MSDTSLNKIIQYGTNAEMLAFTPSPAGSSQILYLFYDTDNEELNYWDGANWIVIAQTTPPDTGITQLTGNVTAGPGSGSQVATIPAATVTEAMQVLADNTTQDVSIAKHGYAPKAPNDATKFLDGTGAYTVPSVGGSVVDNGTFNARLTLETGVPISITDQIGKTTVYLTPFNGNTVALYTGSAWIIKAISELSLALGTLTSGANYDIWLDYNAGTPQLVLSAAWTNSTTRSEAIALQDGVYVKNGTTAYRLVGTIRTTSTTTTEDSEANRFVGNSNHRSRAPRALTTALETANSWTYSTAAYRQANANTANQLNYIAPLTDVYANAQVLGAVTDSAATSSRVTSGVGVNSTTVNSAKIRVVACFTTGTNPAPAFWSGNGQLGLNFLAWLETGRGTDTQTHIGDNNVPAEVQAGIIGTVWS